MDVCKKCNHGMMLHGCVDGIGYCMEGNGDWCDCTVKGLTYEEEIKLLKTERIKQSFLHIKYMTIATTTKTYLELCDSAYESWKSYVSTYAQTVSPFWESLRKQDYFFILERIKYGFI